MNARAHPARPRPLAVLLILLLASIPASSVRAADPAGVLIRDAYGRTGRTVLDLLIRNDAGAIQALFTPGLRETLGRERLAQLCKARARTHGKPVALGEPSPYGLLVSFPVRCERGAWDLKIGLNLDGAIQTFLLDEASDPAKGSAGPTGDLAPNRIRQDAIRAAERLIELMNADDQAEIQALLTPSLREVLPVPKLADLTREKIRLRGKFTRLGPPAMNQYTAVFTAFTERGDWQLRIRLDKEGSIAALFFTDPEPGLAVPDRNSTPLRLPFRGEWLVLWGGDTEAANYHIGTGGRPQRRAIDFTVRGPAGKSYVGDGRKNADYLAYGQEILAAADGVVVTVIDGVPENRPGLAGTMAATGNLVMLRHAPAEFTAVYHLIPGSIQVKVGDAVQAGQVLGRCGNSGNSSGPHLHFQVTNSDDYAVASGIAPHFDAVQLSRDGAETLAPDYTPARNDRVRPATTPAAGPKPPAR